MRFTTTFVFVLILGIQSSAIAQEGFPLNGTWRGQWEVPDPPLNRAVVVMEFNGTDINGMLNPGRNSLEFDTITLDPETWTVRMETNTPEGDPIIIEGVLEDIGSYNRTITGIWMHGDESYRIVFTRE